MQIKTPKYPLVEVKWLDAQSGFSTPQTIEELESVEPLLTYSSGYLIKKDEEKIIVGFMMFGEEELMFKHWQLIPCGMVKDIRYLKRE